MEGSAIRRIWQMAAGMKDPINFSIGAPDFSPPEPLKQGALEAVANDCSTYTVTQGLPELREKLAGRVGEEFGWSDPSVLVTCGLSGALTLALLGTMNAGDDVLVVDPFFVSYRQLVRVFGGRPVYVDTYPDFRLTGEALEAAVTAKSKLLLLNSPANPTGAVYSEAELREVADVARRHNLLVLSDDIYQEFCYEGRAANIADYYENVIVMRAFSKTYGAPGWRVGYVAAPDHLAKVVDAMATVQQYTFVCAPHPFQRALLAADACDVSEHMAAYRRKRDAVYEGLKDDFELTRPEGAFYAFVKAPGADAMAFVERAIKANVLIIPGGTFSQRDTHFRLSYATSDEQIEEGVARLRGLARG